MKKYTLFLLIICMLVLGGCNRIIQTNNATVITPSPIVSETPSVPPNSHTIVTPTSTPIPIITPIPTTTPADNPTKAEEILKTMSLEEKVGQMFFVCLKKESVLDDIKTFHLGGLILFASDFEMETKSSIQVLLQDYQKTSKLPLFIGVDEEGGIVNRVSKYSAFRKEPFLSPQDLYKKGGYDLIKADANEKADLLLSLGINVNLAPVCDISTNSTDFIYKRSFGKNAEETSEFVRTIVALMKDKHIGMTLKHFPGYGNNVDTHTGIAFDDRSYDSFITNDFLPFKAGIEAGADSIMVSHNIVSCMDKENPASISPKVHEILRNELNFNGVIITDDLKMDGVKEYAVEKEIGVLAVLAGNDMIITSNYEQQIPSIIEAIQNSQISITQIDESVRRILLWKLYIGIIK